MDYMKFANSTAYTIKLLADAPEAFEGKYGMQNNYQAEFEGKEVLISQKIGSGLDQALDSGVAGDVFVIEKRQDPANPKNFPFHVEKGASQPVERTGVVPHVSSPAQPEWDMINAVKTWHIDKSVALKVAASLSIPEDPGVVESVYHGVFSLLRNDGQLIISRIESCTSLAQLEAIWKSEGALWVELVGLENIGIIQKIKAKMAATFPAPKVEPPPPPPEPKLQAPEGAPPWDDDEPLPF